MNDTHLPTTAGTVLLGIHEQHLQAYAKRRGWNLSINKDIEDRTCKCLDAMQQQQQRLLVLLAGPSEERLGFLSSMFHAEYGDLVTSEVAYMCIRTIEELELDDRPLYVIYGLLQIASTFKPKPLCVLVVPNKPPPPTRKIPYAIRRGTA
jgi:hypothetical protein